MENRQTFTRIPRWVFQGARITLGLIFLIFGLNGFITFIPVPAFHPFMEILVSSGYIYVVKVLEVGAALLFLSNRFVALGVVLAAPVIVNIGLYHLFLDPRNWPMTVVLMVLVLLVAWDQRAKWKPLFDKP